MRHRAHLSLLNRLRAPSRTLGAVVTLALLVIVLLFKPTGLLGERLSEERA